MAARVTIALAVYNDEHYLRATLAGLAAQSYRDFHLVLLDDGSTDGSVAVAEAAASQVPLEVIRAPHRGRHDAKRAVADAALRSGSPYLMVLDSDIVLPPYALARMVTILDEDAQVAAVSAHARSDMHRPHGRGQAFMEDLFLRSNSSADGQNRWIVGGCVTLRREALTSIEIRGDLLEDNDISQKLRRDWKLVTPRDLVATHLGVPTTLWGLVKRGHRDGVRVGHLWRVYPDARHFGTYSRMVPAPLAGAAALGLLTGQPWLVGSAGGLLAGYCLAFLAASREVPADLRTRLAGTFAFTVGNIGFGVGYFQEALRSHPVAQIQEPQRP